jgi:hypothetical protein
MYPAIRYAGRLAGHPVNTLSQTESSIIEGTRGQTHVFNDGSQDHRWGDYSAMTLDPDGCTFWVHERVLRDQRRRPPHPDWPLQVPALQLAVLPTDVVNAADRRVASE